MMRLNLARIMAFLLGLALFGGIPSAEAAQLVVLPLKSRDLGTAETGAVRRDLVHILGRESTVMDLRKTIRVLDDALQTASVTDLSSNEVMRMIAGKCRCTVLGFEILKTPDSHGWQFMATRFEPSMSEPVRDMDESPYYTTDSAARKLADLAARLEYREPGNGFLDLDSTPRASIYVDGKPMGSTPRKLLLEAGEHDLKLVPDNPDYEPFSRRYSIRTGAEDVKRIQFLKKTGLVRLRSWPAMAEVILGDELLGTTPLRLQLPHGRHEIVLRKHDFEELAASIHVNGPEQEFKFDLKHAPASLIVMVPKVYSEAQVLVDGEPFAIMGGKRSISVKLPGKEWHKIHAVAATAMGKYTSETESVRLGPGETGMVELGGWERIEPWTHEAEPAQPNRFLTWAFFPDYGEYRNELRLGVTWDHVQVRDLTLFASGHGYGEEPVLDSVDITANFLGAFAEYYLNWFSIYAQVAGTSDDLSWTVDHETGRALVLDTGEELAVDSGLMFQAGVFCRLIRHLRLGGGFEYLKFAYGNQDILDTRIRSVFGEAGLHLPVKRLVVAPRVRVYLNHEDYQSHEYSLGVYLGYRFSNPLGG